MDVLTSIHADEQTYEWTFIHTDRLTEKQTYGWTYAHTDGQTERQFNQLTYKQTDIEIDIDTQRGIDRMTGTQRDGCIDEQTEGKPKDI